MHELISQELLLESKSRTAQLVSASTQMHLTQLQTTLGVA